MIKYNSSNINDWYFDTSNIIKVYRNNAVCYYKVTSDTPTPVQEPCFAVVDDISQYSDTEFEDVFNLADEKWYKLNNLDNYEQYGIYGEGRNITYYDGKLTIDDGYEYMYSGGSWVNLGEVTGGTASLPDVPFTLNYNAKNYDASTHTIPYTEGALNAIDAVITGTTANIIDHSSDGYIELTGSTASSAIRALVGTTNFSRSSSNPNITIICKAYTPGSSTEGNILSNRKESYNWMYRHKSSILTFHGQSEQGSITVSNTEPNTCSVRIDSSRLLTYNNWTQNTTSSYSNFNYGSNSNGGALFAGYYSSTGEFWKGVFYWIYMSLNTLTDEQVQQVIAYNEGGGGQTEYPLEYVVREDPPDNLTFNTMEDAEAYECPWYGMSALIAGEDYMFCEGNEWLTKYSYVEVAGDYICDNGDKYKKMQEYDRQADGTTSPTSNYVKGDLIESGSPDCSQHFDGKWIAYYADESVAYSAECSSSTAITKTEVRSGSYQLYKKVIIGDCVNRIREAFQQCTAMTDVEIGTGVTESLYYAFEDCTALTSVTWYATSLANQDGGFQRCSALQKLVMYATTPPTLSSTFFRGVPSSLIIYVPDSAISAYQNKTYWANYTIKGHSELPT